MIEIGLYQHYKGDYYFVEGSSVNPDTGEEIVHYRDAAGYWQHRSFVEFTGFVRVGMAESDSKTVLRYMKIHSQHHPAEARYS